MININYELLDQQVAKIIHLRFKAHHDKLSQKEKEALDGVIALLEALQDDHDANT